AIGDVVQARLEQLQQPLAGDALGARRLVIRLAELALEQAVDVAHLLLLAQLLAVVGEARAGFLAVLPGRVAAPIHRALVGEAFLALEEELLPLAAAMTALVEISCHSLSPTLAGASARGSRCAARASHRRSR